jgi:hypothetical protein
LTEKHYVIVFGVQERTFVEGNTYKTWMIFKKTEKAVIEEILNVKDKPQKVQRIFVVNEYGVVTHLELVVEEYELKLVPKST